MVIVFNACNLLIGGGRRVGNGILSSLYSIELEDEIHVFLPHKKSYSYVSTDKIKIHYLPVLIFRYFPGFLYSWYLLFKIQTIRPDAIFSIGNYAVPFCRKQLVMLQWPYAVYPESIVWKRMKPLEFWKRKIRLFIIKKSLLQVNDLTVQTDVMKSRVKNFLGFKGRIHVVPSSGSHLKTMDNVFTSNTLNIPENPDSNKLLLFISEYYSHKNLEIVIPLGKLIKESKLGYKIILTLDTKNPYTQKILSEVSDNSLEETIYNLGRIKQEDTRFLMTKCDGLLFPTLLESFGIPYLEAALCRIPIFTSNFDFAKIINEDAAWYFDPFSPEDIINTIQQAFNDEKELNEKISKAYKKADNNLSWESITERYIEILKKL